MFNGELSGLKPTLYNALMVFLFAALTIPLAKYLTAKYNIPGFSAWVASI